MYFCRANIANAGAVPKVRLETQSYPEKFVYIFQFCN